MTKVRSFCASCAEARVSPTTTYVLLFPSKITPLVLHFAAPLAPQLTALPLPCHRFRPSFVTLLQRSGVQAVLAEINDLAAKRLDMMAEVNTMDRSNADTLLEYLPALVIRESAIRRNKRCLLAYMQARFDFVRGVWWDTAGAVPESVRGALAQEEQEALDSYGSALRAYQDELGVSVLTDLQPPTTLLTRVVVLRDAGEVITHYGPLRLEKGARHVLRRADAELLVRQGVVEHIQ